uniref:Gamma-glutamyltranspeptidase 3-like n=1 Tax=Saccoglossus kowalevskii TaxID=10224 RepID=A0ABM0MM20_SACKO
MSGTIPTHIENDSELPHIAVNGKDVVSLEEVDLSADTLLLDCEDTLNRERSESDESHDVNESSPFTFEEHKPQKNDNGLKIIIIMSLVFAVSVTTALIVNIYIGPHQVATHGAVSCGVEQCSQVGVEILKKGGHAVDGAVATMLCMGLIGAESSGIGGGGFMLIRDGDSVDALDFRETAPGDSTQDMYSNNNTAADIGGLAVAVPGELKGMQMAWKKYGRLRWSELFHPTIQLAKEGFKVTGHTVDSLKSETAKFSYSKKLRDLYMPGGVPVKEGDTLKRLDYAEVLDTIAKEGIDAFYNGSLTNDIVATVKNAGGILTKKDLYDYKAIWKTPLQTMYH